MIPTQSRPKVLALLHASRAQQAGLGKIIGIGGFRRQVRGVSTGLLRGITAILRNGNNFGSHPGYKSPGSVDGCPPIAEGCQTGAFCRCSSLATACRDCGHRSFLERPFRAESAAVARPPAADTGHLTRSARRRSRNSLHFSARTDANCETGSPRGRCRVPGGQASSSLTPL